MASILQTRGQIDTDMMKQARACEKQVALHGASTPQRLFRRDMTHDSDVTTCQASHTIIRVAHRLEDGLIPLGTLQVREGARKSQGESKLCTLLR